MKRILASSIVLACCFVVTPRASAGSVVVTPTPDSLTAWETGKGGTFTINVLNNLTQTDSRGLVHSRDITRVNAFLEKLTKVSGDDNDAPVNITISDDDKSKLLFNESYHFHINFITLDEPIPTLPKQGTWQLNFFIDYYYDDINTGDVAIGETHSSVKLQIRDVPEPSSLVMSALGGMISLAYWRRKWLGGRARRSHQLG